jgi:hypothetical protein
MIIPSHIVVTQSMFPCEKLRIRKKRTSAYPVTPMIRFRSTLFDANFCRFELAKISEHDIRSTLNRVI